MSHTLLIRQIFPVATVMITIQNYTVGGESILPSELNLGSVDGVVFGTCPPAQNSLAVPLFPVISGGKIMLFRFVSGAPQEIPTTANLNATFPAIVVSGG